MRTWARPRKTGCTTFRCPWAEEHHTESDSKTVYYEAHHDGNPRPACKCMSTSHEELTYGKLVQWLREEGHLTKADEDKNTEDVLDDYDVFRGKAAIGQFLNEVPEVREFAWDKFAPVGKVTVSGGPRWCEQVHAHAPPVGVWGPRQVVGRLHGHWAPAGDVCVLRG